MLACVRKLGSAHHMVNSALRRDSRGAGLSRAGVAGNTNVTSGKPGRNGRETAQKRTASRIAPLLEAVPEKEFGLQAPEPRWLQPESECRGQ